jgi:hypothetical protein
VNSAIAAIESSHAAERRERARQVLAFDNDAIFEFVRSPNLNGHTYSPGDRITGALLGESAFRFCAQTRMLRRIDLIPA